MLIFKKEKTEGENYCYMPALGSNEKLWIYGPSFILDLLGTALEISGIEPGAYAFYFVSGSWIEYKKHSYNDARMWPNSWGIR